MSRLLFAAARGARIEVEPLDGVWIISRKVPYTKLQKCPSLYRTHPDDAHLAYGPISTALREIAETYEAPYTLCGLMAEEAISYEAPYPSLLVVTELHRSLFLLILAEALADEGL